VNKLPPKTLVVAIAACFLAVVLALVGAELPADVSFIEALPFWLTVVGTAAFFLKTVSATIDRFFDGNRLAPLLKTSVIGAVTIVVVTVPIALMCLPIDDLLPDSDSLFETSSTVDPMSALFWRWADQYLNLLPAIAGFWLFVQALDFAFPEGAQPSSVHGAIQGPSDGPSDQAADVIDHPSDYKPSALERRFPEISGLALFAIEADEHYVRLHTDAGSKHVLYRFRDALKDVEEKAGLRVHRSWWVSENAVESSLQTGSTLALKLKSGLTVPVSQTYRRDVERMIEARSSLRDEGLNPS
jgi:hypothetical protein